MGLARLLADRGEDAAAEKLYRRVIASGDPEQVPFAEWNLANILKRRGEDAEAEKLYQRAIDTGDPDPRPRWRSVWEPPREAGRLRRGD